jgi:hypothetical protein
VDERMVREIARREGLEKALAEFPDDVAAAAISAAKVTETIRRSGGASPSEPPPSEPSLLEPSLLEPWPPMVVARK